MTVRPLGRPLGRRALAATLTVLAAVPAVAAATALPSSAAPNTNKKPPAPAPGARTGTAADGSTWRIDVPTQWNGTLLVFSHGLVAPGDENPAVDAPDAVTASALLDRGFALAGSSFPGPGWVLAEAQRDQLDLVRTFETAVGRPQRTVAWGASMGGLVSALLAEHHAGRFDGALSLCGSLAGSTATMNSYLDALFVAKALLAPNEPIELVRITDPFQAIDRMGAALDAAQATPEGRARIALAAAVADLPGWTDPDEAEPAPTDTATRQRHQYETLRLVTLFLGMGLRADIEARVGANPSWNTGVDYAKLLQRSSGAAEVKALYGSSSVNLAQDLATLAQAPRIAADAKAVAALDRLGALDGDLSVPVLTLHDEGDPLLPVVQEQAYAAVVRAAGHGDELRQAFVHRAGHCAFTPAETVAALQALVHRIDSGHWGGAARSAALNAAALALGPVLNAHVDEDTGAVFPIPPAFEGFTPGRFPR